MDFGCGFGFDATHYGWKGYDPFYGPFDLEGPYDRIVCTHVLNAISDKHRTQALETIQSLLTDQGRAFVCVARNIPRQGKQCDLQRRQYYVLLEGPETVYVDGEREIYMIKKDTAWKDVTLE